MLYFGDLLELISHRAFISCDTRYEGGTILADIIRTESLLLDVTLMD